MEGVNLCEDCGNTAVAFGMKGTAKFRSCEEHLASYLSKGMQIYDIAGYYFMQSGYDAPIFEERKNLVAKGKGNLSVLEASCESERNEALHTIESVKGNVIKSVEDRFEEMKAVVTGATIEIKNRLAEVQLNLKQYLTSRENQLSDTAYLLCADMSAVPRLLRFGVADVSDRISAVLSDSWMVSTADIKKEPATDRALADALQYAAKGVQEALLHADLLTGETALNEAQIQVVSMLLAWERGRTEGNVKWLQRSWDLKQRYAFPASMTVRVGQQLANLLCTQLRQYSTAEQILIYCYDIVSAQDSLSTDEMSLCADMCGVYAAREQYEKLDSMGQWTLQTFETSGHPSEYYWTIVFYLIYAMHQLGKQSEAAAVMQKWGKTRADNNLSTLLQLLTFGVNCYYEGDEEEAGKLLQQARSVGISHFPTSLFTAVTLTRLALVCSEDSREQLYRQAQAIYEIAAPMSHYAGVNFTNMGRFLANTKRWREAEVCYRQAQSIYEFINPKSTNSASNINSMGQLFYSTSRWNEAEECYRQAQSIYATTAPETIAEAINLNCWGRLCFITQRMRKAEEYYLQAQSIYESTAAKSLHAAKNLASMGRLFGSTKRWSEAEDCHELARSILSVVAPMSPDAAHNLNSMGLLFERRGQLKEAQQCHQLAQVIYDIAAPKSINAAINLSNLGLLLYNTLQLKEAKKCHVQALSIYEFAAPQSADVASSLYNLGLVYKAMRKLATALEYFRKAVPIYAGKGNEKMKSAAEVYIAEITSQQIS